VLPKNVEPVTTAEVSLSAKYEVIAILPPQTRQPAATSLALKIINSGATPRLWATVFGSDESPV